MNIPQGLSRFYGPRIYFDTDDKGGGGGNGDQTDWKAKYEQLNGQIAAGQYVTKDSYVTLQRNLETAVNEKKAAVGDLGNAQAKIALLTDDTEKLQKNLNDEKTAKQEVEADNQAKRVKLERHKVIFKDYPHLAGFEADELIPDPKGEQKLDDVLKAFSDRVTSLSGKAVDDFKKTSTPPVPPRDGEAPKGKDALLNEAKSLLGQGKTAEYNLKMDEYHAAKKTEA